LFGSVLIKTNTLCSASQRIGARCTFTLHAASIPCISEQILTIDQRCPARSEASAGRLATLRCSH